MTSPSPAKPVLLLIVFLIIITLGSAYYYSQINGFRRSLTDFSHTNSRLQQDLSDTKTSLDKLTSDYQALLATDQIKINKDLTDEIAEIQKTYQQTVKTYEALISLREKTTKTSPFDILYAKSLSLLSQRQYASASALLTKLNSDIKVKEDEISSSFKIPSTVKSSDTPPGAGYSRQVVVVDNLNFMVDIYSADLRTTKVLVDTASTGDCRNDCPVLHLSEFVKRNNPLAVINGPYFCPASYPSCADKKNSFDTLLMNKNKTYFNSANNVYSSVPAAIFSTTSRFVSKSQEWGRDTGVDSVIAGQPLLVFNGESKFGGDGDTKKTSKGPRSFIGATDSTVYIGIVHNATVADVARVLVKMGVRNAINLDSGASTGFYVGSKAVISPSRDTPFGIVLVKR